MDQDFYYQCDECEAVYPIKLDATRCCSPSIHEIPADKVERCTCEFGAKTYPTKKSPIDGLCAHCDNTGYRLKASPLLMFSKEGLDKYGRS